MILSESETERTLAGATRVDPHGITPDWFELRFVVQAYEEAQARRVRHGEQLRAVLSGRSATETPLAPAADCDSELQDIRDGTHAGRFPHLGALYHRAAVEEESARRSFESLLAAHPAWPWVRGVRGMGEILGARLLARLDLGRAPRPSSFWAYCGLDTVPGVAVSCDACGREFRVAAGRVPASHRESGKKTWCRGRLSEIPATKTFRVAAPTRQSGERRRHDPVAKKVCYLIGISFLRSRSSYSEPYRRRREDLARTHPDWPKKRAHLTALRVAVKLFLRDLWMAWRRAEMASDPNHDVGPREQLVTSQCEET